MRILIAIVLFALTYLNADACVFCKEEIIEEQSVFESDYFNVLPNDKPQMKGHLMVIPKRHIVKAHELTKEEWEDLSVIIPKVVQFFSDFLNTDQYIIFEKNGPRAWQHVHHVHFHLFPVTNQTWEEIFNYSPERLKIEIEKEVALYRPYFGA